MRLARPESSQPGINPATARRAPTQQRSRERVRKILDAAAELVVAEGVDAVSTRSIAKHAGVPVASLYQYFAHKDDVILAVVEDDTAAMDAAVIEAIGDLEVVSIRTVVEATMRAFVGIYHQRPAFVVIWWRGRSSIAVSEYCREHNRRVAAALYDFVQEAGLITAEADKEIADLAVEVGDRVFEHAFQHDLRGNQRIINEGIEMVTAYLERYATPAGLTGVASK